MGKRSREDAENGVKSTKSKSKTAKPFRVEEAAVDPSLALLFASSAGPVKAPPKARYTEPPPPIKRAPVEEEDDEAEVEGGEDDDDDEELSSVEGDIEDMDIAELSDEEEGVTANPLEADDAKQPRKRKRQNKEDDLEGKYMLKLAKEEEKEESERQAERRLKRQRLMAEQDPDNSEEAEDLDGSDEASEGSDEESAEPRVAPLDVPQHETLAAVQDQDAIELEKATRTVFLANVSTAVITDKHSKKTLLEHMASFIDSIPPAPEGKPKHKVESIRFRSTAYAGGALPKKAAYATKNLMDATTKSTNAYVVYSTAFAAREAAKRLNGTMVLDRHLRVDGVAHPAKTDHRRCVFVGNLGFVDDESMMDQGGENERKRSKIPSDIEEGLWRQFGKAGAVESVRVVRDEKTRVGKGFAYVQFEDANAVEAALLFHEKKYPPMLPRTLRVTRAKAVKKTALASQHNRANPKPTANSSSNPNRQPIYNPKMSSQQQSLQGRAGKLLGRAGAAQFRKRDDAASGQQERRPKVDSNGMKTPEAIVFEGYRASANAGRPKDLKLGGKGGGKKTGKPKNRGAKRGAEWKKKGGKKAA